MASNSEILSLLTGYIGLSLVLINSTAAARSIVRRLDGPSTWGQHDGIRLASQYYADEDGDATDESVRKFSDKWQRMVIGLLSIAGFEVALGLAITTTAHVGIESYGVQSWLQVGVWACLVLQTVAFFTEPLHTERFVQSQLAFCASIFAMLIPCLQVSIGILLDHQSINRPSIGLVVTQVVIAFLRGTCCLLVPRRPDVYHEGKVVDQQYSVSILHRMTFSWINGLLRHAVQKKSLELADLPTLPLSVRPEILHTRFERVRKGHTLWASLVIAHWRSFLLQLTLALVSCALSFGPQVALYRILKCLEDRGLGTQDTSKSWIWVSALGCFMLLSSSIDSWLFWTVYSKLGVPIYEELAALVFAKSMRKKDVKDAKMTYKPSESAMDPSTAALLDAEEEDEQTQEGLQSIINYAAVDAKRVADFACYSYLIPHAILRLTIACGFLLSLLGWRSLSTGLLVAAVIIPVNSYLATRYAKSQDDLMKLRDLKLAVVSEVLQGIRQIKFSAIEGQWEKKIAERRHAELQSLWTSFLYSTGLISTWILGPLMLSAASLTVYALLYGELTASVAFTAMSIFGSLELSMASLPGLMSKALEAKISSDRIDKYMASPEKPVNTTPANDISFEAASIAWPADEDHNDWDTDGGFVLRNLNLSFPPKGLSVISGKTGSGKSLLLASILGECDILQGKVKVPVAPQLNVRYDRRISSAEWIIDNATAYVAQIPWIENGTIRDNILFGLPYHPARYRKVLYACALDKDLDMFPDKEMTDIGANGVNLSGGQRWRVSFARALYSRAGILIMDDIFSALDTHTGRHVYNHGLTGEIGQKRTRILVTHHASLCLPQTDYSVLLENGCVKFAGTAEELRRNNSLSDLLLLEESTRPEVHKHIQAPREYGIEPMAVPNKVRSGTRNRTSTAARRRSSVASRQSSIASRQSRRSSVWSRNANIDQTDTRPFVQDEANGTGSVSLSVYAAYCKKGGSAYVWGTIFGAYILYACLIVGRSWWVKLWTGSSNNQEHPSHHPSSINIIMDRLASVKADADLSLYLGVYVGISVMACVLGTVRYYTLMKAGTEASKNLFDDLTYAVLRAPLRWLDTVPLGRILNRFTSDIYAVDVRLGYDIGLFVHNVLEISGILLAGMAVSPFVIVFAAVILAICLKLALMYLAGAREVKRLESIVKSPIFEQFGSSLAGLITIRAFNKTDTYIGIMYEKISVHARTTWYLWLFNMWLDYRMSVVGAIFSTMTAALVVYFPSIPAALAGFALSFALQYNSAIVMVLRQYANVELDMNATERVLEYSNIEIEDQTGMEAPASWPTEGKVEVEDLVVGYAPDLPPVLNGLSFTMEKNQRVGVVGRSGAGKSSLTLALFRFLEARWGRISIDGLDISKLKLHDLRSRLAIIPQDPVLFSGTVRSNLDPFNEHSDPELYDALERVNLISFSDTETLASESSTQPQITRTMSPKSTTDTLASSHTNCTKDNSLFTTLSDTISEGGFNLSQGQRQLLCLARAIVSRPRVMILDEATSAVDMETDALIQRSIRSEFGRNASTLLVIAHRLSTVADFDRILVMDAGRAVEFGCPKELMGIEGGMFRGLAETSGEKSVLEEIILGKSSDS